MARKFGEPGPAERELTQVDVDNMRNRGEQASQEPQPEPRRAKGPGSLMRVVVEVAGRTYDEDLASQAFIAPNVDALNDALATNPSRYAEWAMLEALAKSEVADIDGKVALLETEVKEREAQAYLDIVNAVVPGGKAPTVDAIKAMVTVDEKRIDIVRRKQVLDVARLAAQDNLSKLGVGRKTMEEKKDSLLELSRNWRQEMQTQLTTNAEKFKPGGR